LEGVASFEPIPPSLVLEVSPPISSASGTRHFHMKAVNVPKSVSPRSSFQPDTAPIALAAYDEYLNPPHARDDESYRKIDPTSCGQDSLLAHRHRHVM